MSAQVAVRMVLTAFVTMLYLVAVFGPVVPGGCQDVEQACDLVAGPGGFDVTHCDSGQIGQVR